MLTNFSYIIPGFLAGCALPGSLAPLPEDLSDSREQGITAIVSLTERPLPNAFLQEAGLRYLHIPIPDMTAPTLAQVDQFIAFAESERAQGGRVLVHCFAGHGRTGTMLAAWLIKQGKSAAEAIDEIRRLRPGSIETQRQITLLENFADRVQRR